MAHILIRRGGKEYGPYEAGLARQYLASGELLEDDLAWTEGFDDWTTLKALLETFDGSETQVPAGPYTSADAVGSAVPDGIAGWSWAAFLVAPIWGLFNQVWIGLLGIIPGLNFVVGVWLGLKGRQMAWARSRWDSVEHFQRVQHRWSQWSVGLVICFVVASVGYVAGKSYTQQTEAPQADGAAPVPQAGAQLTAEVKAKIGAALQAHNPVSREVFQAFALGAHLADLVPYIGPGNDVKMFGKDVGWIYSADKTPLSISPETSQPDWAVVLVTTADMDVKQIIYLKQQ